MTYTNDINSDENIAQMLGMTVDNYTKIKDNQLTQEHQNFISTLAGVTWNGHIPQSIDMNVPFASDGSVVRFIARFMDPGFRVIAVRLS